VTNSGQVSGFKQRSLMLLNLMGAEVRQIRVEGGLFVNCLTTNRMVNTPASYSGGCGFKFLPEDRLWCGFRGFLQSLQANAGISQSKLRPHHILSNLLLVNCRIIRGCVEDIIK
jgi:hypothetical protein